jgi:uncharacterized protein DUF2809
MDRRGAEMMLRRAGLCLLVIASGLVLRGFGREFGLAAPIVKYGGSILWGTMVFLIVAILARGQRRATIAGIAMFIAAGVELSRLVHTPWLDGFRLTLAGALLLGRVFSPWDIAAYAAGIALGTIIDRLLHDRMADAN